MICSVLWFQNTGDHLDFCWYSSESLRGPKRDSLWRNHNDWSCIYLHTAILRIFFAQKRNRATVCFAALQYTCRSGDQNVAELTPILVVVINHQRDLRILLNIAQALELGGRSALWLFIDGRVKGFAVEREADRDDVRLIESIGRGELSDTGRANKGEMFLRERHCDKQYWSNGVVERWVEKFITPFLQYSITPSSQSLNSPSALGAKISSTFNGFFTRPCS